MVLAEFVAQFAHRDTLAGLIPAGKAGHRGLHAGPLSDIVLDRATCRDTRVIDKQVFQESRDERSSIAVEDFLDEE